VSIATVVTRGYGSYGTVNLVVIRGYGSGSTVVVNTDSRRAAIMARRRLDREIETEDEEIMVLFASALRESIIQQLEH